MKKKHKRYFLILSLLAVFFFSCSKSANQNKQENQQDAVNKIKGDIVYKDNLDFYGYVPDEETAIKIAKTVWVSKYGYSIYNKKTF